MDNSTAAQTIQHRPVYLRSVRTSKPQIDLEERIVRDVIMAQVGEAEGHGVHVELQFLKDLVAFAKSQMGGRVQANMGHNWDNLFKQFGTYENIRLKGRQVIADLKVYKAAENTPAGENMADWFFTLIKEDPQAINCSLRVVAEFFYQYDDSGKMVILRRRWDRAFDDRPVFMKFGKLKSCDLVEDGALTDTLFSDGTAPDIFYEIISQPEFQEVLAEHYQEFEPLTSFYQRLFAEKRKSLLAQFKSYFKSQPDMKDKQTPATEPTLEDLQSRLEQQDQTIKDLQVQLSGAKPPPKETTEEPTTEDLRARLDQSDQTIKDLQTQLAALEEEPEKPPASGRSDEKPLAAGGDPAYLQCPITQKAKDIQMAKRVKNEKSD